MSNRSGSSLSAPRDSDRVPTLLAASTSDGATPITLEADPNTHRLIVDSAGGSSSLPTVLRNGQQTVTTSAVALSAGALTVGVIFEALSTNTVSIFVGGAGVTTSTGIELQPGAALSAAISNTNLIYVICASSTPKITWLGS